MKPIVPSKPVASVAEAAAAATSQINPANDPKEAGAERRRRVPMSVPTRKLEVDPIPGFHLHWFAENKVPRARAAGYEIVNVGEVTLNGNPLGGGMDGNTDLGSNVSIVGSVDGPNGHERLVLMKLREEFWQEDCEALRAKNEGIYTAIFGGEIIGTNEQGQVQSLPDHAYVKQAESTSPALRRKPIMNRGMPKAKSASGGRFTI
jgi:hypothetical protein